MKTRMMAIAMVLLLGVTPAAAQTMDINTVINSIGTPKFMDDASDAHSAPSVRVIRLSSLAAAERSAARLSRKVASQARAVHFLRASLAINPTARTAIRNAGLSLDQIVALHMSGDRAVVLYADDL